MSVMILIRDRSDETDIGLGIPGTLDFRVQLEKEICAGFCTRLAEGVRVKKEVDTKV